jgi:hypothetical protein
MRDMKRQEKDDSAAKTVVYTRFSPATIKAIDDLCEANPLKPNRARLIEAAVVEYIERHGGGANGRRSKGGE